MKILLLLILTFSGIVGFSQIQGYYKYWNGSFCDKNIYLNLDGTFYYKEGCEGESSICKGKYTLKKRTITFSIDSSENGKLKIIVTGSPAKSHDSIYISAIDENKKPLRNFRIALLPVPSGTGNTFMCEMIETNDRGFVIIDKKQFTHFTYQNLIELNAEKETPWIEFEEGKNFYTMQFNYPNYCLEYNRIKIFSSALEPLRIKKGELHDRRYKIVFTKE